VRATRPDELTARAEVHRRAWSVLPFAHGTVASTSSVSVASYAELARCESYRPALDGVVESPTGELLACANGWLDERTATVELEPVGTVAEARGLGLAGAACAEVLCAARLLGARHGIVYARGDPAYPRPLRTYTKLGFEPYARTWTLTSPG
jgi:GNAT superfamily N-acetyltransferase